jgi:RNA polymerase sigma factor (sigma-70 family)
MNGQIGLSSSISNSSERVSVRDQIKRIKSEIFQSAKAVSVFVPPPPPSESEKKISIQELLAQIKKSYLDDLAAGVGLLPIVDDSNHGVELTRDQIAVAVALDMSGKKPLSMKDRLRYNTMLYDSIRNLVYLRASRYSVTCPEESVDDLAQECMFQILKKLHGFNPKRGAFSTWSWYVCTGTMNRKYRNGQKSRKAIVSAGHFVDEDGNSMLENLPESPLEGVQSHECQGIMANEIMDSVRELAGNYPEQKQLIFEIFGNPDSEQFVMPSNINVSESAKAIGMKYSRAHSFFKTVIRPFFQKQLAGC